MMKTKTFNGVRIKNTEFAKGEMLFDMDLETAIKYKELVNYEYKNVYWFEHQYVRPIEQQYLEVISES